MFHPWGIPGLLPADRLAVVIDEVAHLDSQTAEQPVQLARSLQRSVRSSGSTKLELLALQAATAVTGAVFGSRTADRRDRGQCEECGGETRMRSAESPRRGAHGHHRDTDEHARSGDDNQNHRWLDRLQLGRAVRHGRGRAGAMDVVDRPREKHSQRVALVHHARRPRGRAPRLLRRRLAVGGGCICRHCGRLEPVERLHLRLGGSCAIHLSCG